MIHKEYVMSKAEFINNRKPMETILKVVKMYPYKVKMSGQVYREF